MCKGFIFSGNKCVACGSCSAACVLENGWTVHPRTVFTYNSETLPLLPLYNLSMACNHCEKAPCLNGCPAQAFSRDSITGAVILDESKCIGCKYCIWNCPYNAPKFESEKGTIGKCNLCNELTSNGLQPACASACPTGALGYSELPGSDAANQPSWFPERNLKPALSFTESVSEIPLRIIPEITSPDTVKPVKENFRLKTGDWSLMAFSFISTISVSYLISSLLKSNYPDRILFVLLIVSAGLISLIHLGKILRSWRSVKNFKTSPLSREIFFFLLYSVCSIVAVFFENPTVLLISSFLGLIFLISVDRVYIYSDKRPEIITHGGQTFISALLIISFFTGSFLPFIFIATLKLGASVFYIFLRRNEQNNFIIKFIRIAFLVITILWLFTGRPFTENAIISIFLTGEVLDRILFYQDFDPININSLIIRNIKLNKDEKERG